MKHSVYVRVCNGINNVDKYVNRLKFNLPSKGSIRYLVLTDKQYCSMKFLVGMPKKQEEKINSSQLNVF